MNGRTMDRKALRRGFGALQMLYWCGYGAANTYIVSYVTSVRGVNASLTGLLLAVFMLCACAGQYIINGICDRMQNNRLVFMSGVGASLVIWLAVYFAPGLVWLFIAYGLLGLVQPAMSSVLDTWLIRSFPDDPGVYSPLRSLASLAYAIMMSLMGFAIDGLGHVVMAVLLAVFSVGGVLVAAVMPEIPRLEAPNRKAASGEGGFGSVPKMVWLFVVAMAALGIANMPLLNLNQLIMESVGGSVAHSGIAIGFNTAAEFIVMRFGVRYLYKVQAKKKLVFAVVLYLLASVIILLARGTGALYVGFFINGFAFGVLLPARRQFVNENAPAGLLNRLHGIGDMAYQNVGGLAGNQIGGLLTDRYTARAMTGMSMVMQTIALLLLTVFRRAPRRESGKVSS